MTNPTAHPLAFGPLAVLALATFPAALPAGKPKRTP